MTAYYEPGAEAQWQRAGRMTEFMNRVEAPSTPELDEEFISGMEAFVCTMNDKGAYGSDLDSLLNMKRVFTNRVYPFSIDHTSRLEKLKLAMKDQFDVKFNEYTYCATKGSVDRCDFARVSAQFGFASTFLLFMGEYKI